MSAKAIEGRLEIVRALYKLMQSLRTIDISKARRVQDDTGTPTSDR